MIGIGLRAVSTGMGCMDLSEKGVLKTFLTRRNWNCSNYWKISKVLWPASGRTMRTAVSSTRGGYGDHGVVQSSLTSWAQRTYALWPGIWIKRGSALRTFLLWSPEWKGEKSEQSASRDGQGGRPCPKERWSSSKNICSAPEVLLTKPLRVNLRDGEGLAFLHRRLVKAAEDTILNRGDTETDVHTSSDDVVAETDIITLESGVIERETQCKPRSAMNCIVSVAPCCYQLHSSSTAFFTITVTRCNLLYHCVHQSVNRHATEACQKSRADRSSVTEIATSNIVTMRQSAIPPFRILNTVWCSTVLVFRTRAFTFKHDVSTGLPSCLVKLRRRKMPRW